jgi:hypothetical protein
MLYRSMTRGTETLTTLSRAHSPKLSDISRVTNQQIAAEVIRVKITPETLTAPESCSTEVCEVIAPCLMIAVLYQ